MKNNMQIAMVRYRFMKSLTSLSSTSVATRPGCKQKQKIYLIIDRLLLIKINDETLHKIQKHFFSKKTFKQHQTTNNVRAQFAGGNSLLFETLNSIKF